jgi:hypothetical protein
MSKIDDAMKNPAFFMEEFCYIRSEAGLESRIKLMPYQPELLRVLMDREHTAIPKARMIGMTTLMGLYGLWRMVCEGETVAVVTQRFEAGKNILIRLRNTVELLAPMFHIKIEDHKTGDLMLSNGGRCLVTSAQSFPSVLKRRSADLVLWDEMAHCDDMLRIGPDVMPHLTNGGQIIAYSSPSGRGDKNAFQKLLEGIPSNGFRKVKLDWRVNTNMNPDRINEIRKMLGEDQFKREYELIP